MFSLLVVLYFYNITYFFVCLVCLTYECFVCCHLLGKVYKLVKTFIFTYYLHSLRFNFYAIHSSSFMSFVHETTIYNITISTSTQVYGVYSYQIKCQLKVIQISFLPFLYFV